MTLVIRADLLIPGRGEPVENGVMVAEGATITYAGPAAGAPSTPEADTEEVAVLMPGLWDCHAHLFGSTQWNLETAVWIPPAQSGARAATDLQSYIEGGVTSVREVGGYGVELAPVVSEGSLVGPSIYGAGAVLSTTGGHGDVHAVPQDIYEGLADHGRILGRLADGPSECMKAVREQLRRGAQVIKICASGGVMSEVDHPIHQQFSDEELAAIVSEAARAERVVAAHCHGKPGIMAALRAGVKTIEHGTYLDEEAAELMKERDAVLVATRFIVEELMGLESKIPPYAWKKISRMADQHAQALKIAVATGVKVAMGTDIFTSGPVEGFRYRHASREIRHLCEAGMSSLEAIEAATSRGPETLGPQGPKSGILEDGFASDVIALDRNPIDDVSVWGDPERVAGVWKGGRRVK
ncbi:MAG TPA: amidohydrolase family protein [Acidimicrobiia bacterium]|nr:amidohydrolase family protein [Acidimicrobiia bacterium]